jgi:transcriptional regulator with XRE-family HTH domain
MEIAKKFGHEIRSLRQRASISQEELAAKSGLHRTYVGSVERGERNLTLSSAERLATALNVKLMDIFGKIDT